MLSIGEFSKICEVSTKTLRYYDEIGLISPNEVNFETGYRYYSIQQLETMLFISRLKSYNFSLEEIKVLLTSEKTCDDFFYQELLKKQHLMQNQITAYEKNLLQLQNDLKNLQQGKSILCYLDDIDVQLVEVPDMNLLCIRKMVNEYDIKNEYSKCFHTLLQKIKKEKLTISDSPMVLFHNDEFSPLGLDIEFAFPVKEAITGTRDFKPGLCLKTTLQGSYTNLSAVYTKQIAWAQKQGYINNGALFEVYVNDPSQVDDKEKLLTEVYYPIKKN